jgi:hypothetical protein
MHLLALNLFKFNGIMRQGAPLNLVGRKRAMREESEELTDVVGDSEKRLRS